MAVEARSIGLFPSQIISHENFMKSNQVNTNICNTQMDSFVPISEPIMPEQTLSPFYQTLDFNPISDKTESGLTYNNIPAPRKRQRDSINDLDAFSPVSPNIILQSEIDRYISQHTEKVRLELEEQRKRQSRMLISAIQGGVVKKLKEKDEEIQRMGKLIWVLQERVKSLYVENQIWRDVAQTNKATANTLRSNLEQALARAVVNDCGNATLAAPAAEEADAESSCGSSDFGRFSLAAEGAQDKGLRGGVGGGGGGFRMCRRCGALESRVLLMPCRHLCLCTVCGSSLIGSCPVCNSDVDASLHVNVA